MGGQVGLVKIDALLGGGGGVFHVEQVQPVGNARVCAGDGDIKELGLHRPEAEGHLKLRPGGDEPAVVLDPGVGLLELVAQVEFLLEQAVVVVEADTVPGQPQSGDGIQEARSQAAQPAVAQGGLGLHVLDGGQGFAALGQRLLYLIINAQGQQVVGQQLADQKLSGEIVQLALPLGGGAGLGQLLGELEQYVVQLAVTALGGLPAVFGLGQLLHPLFDVHDTGSFQDLKCAALPAAGWKRFQSRSWKYLDRVGPTESIARFAAAVKGFLTKNTENFNAFSGRTYEKTAKDPRSRHDLPFSGRPSPDRSTRSVPPQGQR